MAAIFGIICVIGLVIALYHSFFTGNGPFIFFGVCLMIIGFVVCIASPKLKQEPENKAKTYCEINSISYILVDTTAEYTGLPAEEIAVIFKYASKNGLEIDEALLYIDKNLTENDIIAIVQMSFQREQQLDKQALAN